MPRFSDELLLSVGGERESLFVIVHSLFCVPPGVERVLFLIIFIAAPSSNIVIEESALLVSQPLVLLCLEILNLFIVNKQPCLEKTLHLCLVSSRSVTGEMYVYPDGELTKVKHTCSVG